MNEQCTVPISQFKLQSGHCFLEEFSQSSKDLGIANAGDQLLRLFAELLNLHRLIQVLQDRLLIRVVLELLNQRFDLFFAIRVLLLDCRMRYARYSKVNVAATSFTATSFRCALVV